MLEGYSYEEPWPEEIPQFKIKYETGGERDLTGLNL